MALAYVARQRFFADMNLTELLDKTAGDWPKKMALIEADNAVSYAELVEHTVLLATQLQALKLPPACRIGLYFSNSVNYVALTFALWRIDAAVVPIPMECTEEELSNIATTMQLEAILSQKPRGQSISLGPNIFFTRLTPAFPPDHHGLRLAFIRFTSGTTSARKGVARWNWAFPTRLRWIRTASISPPICRNFWRRQKRNLTRLLWGCGISTRQAARFTGGDQTRFPPFGSALRRECGSTTRNADFVVILCP
jgi:acyl-CoA synthetase (AMP-forming)/AMP-acid ligase II